MVLLAGWGPGREQCATSGRHRSGRRHRRRRLKGLEARVYFVAFGSFALSGIFLADFRWIGRVFVSCASVQHRDILWKCIGFFFFWGVVTTVFTISTWAGWIRRRKAVANFRLDDDHVGRAQ